jgi:pyruvate formate lyase activating enzyme
LIKNAERGICGVRENSGGILNTLVYGKLIARQIDPIEKKPLFHFMPGSLSYSIATAGCNFKCLFCQNADISQLPSNYNGLITGDNFTPEYIVSAAIRGNCRSISYTYTEPTVFFEFALNTSRLASEKGLKNIFVTNGYMTKEALAMIRPFLDAANVDLKAYNNEFYRKMCGARLENVKETLIDMKSSGLFLEITTLLIPGLNDDKKELEELAGFIAESLGTETPWHISRFHPTYRLLDRPSTPLKTLLAARKTGLDCGLKYVYMGNVPGEEGESTFCYKCGKMLIERIGFYIKRNKVDQGLCPHCGAQIDGVW